MPCSRDGDCVGGAAHCRTGTGVSVVPDTLVFNSSTWDTYQHISVIAEEDNFAEGHLEQIVQISHTSQSREDPSYNTGLAQTITVVLDGDNDEPGFVVEPSTIQSSESSSSRSQHHEAGYYRAKLLSEPLDAVTIKSDILALEGGVAHLAISPPSSDGDIFHASRLGILALVKPVACHHRR